MKAVLISKLSNRLLFTGVTRISTSGIIPTLVKGGRFVVSGVLVDCGRTVEVGTGIGKLKIELNNARQAIRASSRVM
jgi:hypothetical protein